MAMRAEPSCCYGVIGALAEITGHLVIGAHENSVKVLCWKVAEEPRT